MSYSPASTKLGSSLHSSSEASPLSTPATEPMSQKKFSREASKAVKTSSEPTGFLFNPAIKLPGGLHISLTSNGETMDKDPFVSSSQSRKEQKLSPTASSFLPFSANRSSAETGDGTSIVYGRSPPVNAGSTSQQHVAETSSVYTTPTLKKPAATQMGTFSTNTGVTRGLKIAGIYKQVTTEEVESCIKVRAMFQLYATALESLYSP